MSSQTELGENRKGKEYRGKVAERRNEDSRKRNPTVGQFHLLLAGPPAAVSLDFVRCVCS